MEELIKIGQAFLGTPQGEKILKQVSKFKGTKEEFDKKKEDLKKLLSIKIQAYTVKGVVSNKQTSKPLPGTKVQPMFALFPIVQETKTKKRVIEEVVFDEDEESENFGKPKLKRDGSVKTKKTRIKVEEEVWVKGDGPGEVKTNKNGEYEMKIGLPVLYEDSERSDSSNEKILGVPLLMFTKDGAFAPNTLTIVSGDGSIKQNLPPIELLDIDKEAERVNDEVQAFLNNISVQQAISASLDVAQKVIIAAKSRVLKFVNIIQTKLFPLAISLMVIFGFAKIAQADQAKCPSNALLKIAIKRRNSVVRQLNQMWAVIAANVALTFVFLQLQVIFRQAKFSISNLPIPLGAPLGVGLPYSLVSKLQGIEELFKELEGANKEIRKALIIALIFLLASIVLIVIYLKKIDELINRCVRDQAPCNWKLVRGDGRCGCPQGVPPSLPDPYTDDCGSTWKYDPQFTMEELNSEILALTVGQEIQGQEPVKIVNGFTLAVVVDRSEQVGDTYRRYATATNSKGVVILKGEPSFSAVDQILLDELAFYIVNNNLKAD